MPTEVTQEALFALFRKNGLENLLDGEKAQKLVALAEHMIDVNKSFNLTAITEPRRVMLEHFLDCAVPASLMPEGAKVLDVGCGGGYPTLPMAILRPDLTVFAIDSTAKKANYVRDTASLLGLSNVTVTAARAEEYLKQKENRETFDAVTARAVAELRILSELCIPALKIGGMFYAMKGRAAVDELAASMNAIEKLGAALEKVKNVTLSDEVDTLEHPLILIRKTSPTPCAYPRPYANILKKPL